MNFKIVYPFEWKFGMDLNSFSKEGRRFSIVLFFFCLGFGDIFAQSESGSLKEDFDDTP